MRWILCTLLTGVLAHAAAAQPTLGDVVVTSHTGNYVGYLDRTTGMLTTLAVLPSDPIPVMMAANNRDVLAVGRAAPGNIWSVDPSGTLTTVAQASASGQGGTVGADWLQDGSVITAHSQFGVQGWLRSVSLQTNTYTTLFNPQISHMRHVAVDGDTGEALVPRWATGGNLLRMDIGTLTFVTVATGINSGSSTDSVPASGNYVVADETSFGNVKIVAPTGGVVRTINTGSTRAVVVDDVTGNFFCAMNSSGTNANRIIEVDAAGNTVNTWGPFGTDGFAGIVMYGSRTVHGQGPATPGTSYAVTFSFPGLAGSAYVGALSLSQRPGITLPGGTVHLALDSLFLASVQGLFVTGFQGVLNANGQAAGAINLPSFLPPGVRFYCAAVAVAGGNIFTGNTIGITTN